MGSRRVLLGFGAGVLLLGLWFTAAALGDASDWEVNSDAALTNVPAPSYRFKYLAANKTPAQRSAWALLVKMPRENAPSGRAVVTIERSFSSVLEGDHIELTFSGQPAEDEADPLATVAIYVHCVFEDQADTQKEKAWVRVGTQTVQPNTSEQLMKKKITGKGCVDTVDLGVSREIDGARIQLRGADEPADRERRTVFLHTFKLFDPGEGENSPTILDDFTKAR